MEELEKKIMFISKCALAIFFLIIAIYLVCFCLFSSFIPEELIARALPLSLLLIAIAIFFSSLSKYS